MVYFLKRYISFADSVNEHLGRAVSWLTVLLVLLFCIDVCLRYFLKLSSAVIFELEWHFFSMIFLLGAGYTLKHDRHVRVDVWYTRMSEKQKAWVNLLGALVFLIPFCLLVIRAGIPYVEISFKLREASNDPGGLPARYLTKGLIMAGFFFLLLQGVSLACRSLLTLLEKEPVQPK
jgi:TRAP-type mannitol/chloroaromatic compound transport system permease small subunit